MNTYQKIEQLYFNAKLTIKNIKTDDQYILMLLDAKEQAFKEVLDIIDADKNYNDFK